MNWEIDPFHSLVEFSVKHLMISTVKGRFPDIHGTINLDPRYPERSWIKVQIKTASIYTGVPPRDAHLRSADFLEVVRYPLSTFVSTQVKLIDPNRCTLYGDLSLHGVTNAVSLHTIFTGQNLDPLTKAVRIGLYATTVIDRREFGINLKQEHNGVLVIGNEIRVDITAEAVQTG